MEKTKRVDDNDENKDNVKLAINILITILKKYKYTTTYTHVIFRFGTVISLNCDVDDFKGFTDGYDFPDYRVNEEVKKQIMKENEHDWKWAQTLPQLDLIKKAYYILINDGYPYPGGEGADRNCIPVNNNCFITIFLNRKRAKNIFTLSYTNEIDDCTKIGLQMIHANLGGRYRRNDYMMPQIYAIIDDKLKLTIFE